VHAQELPPVRNFSPKVYSAENQNWSVTQADDRKMYFANNKGLLEFNGSQWQLYPTPNESIMRSVCWHAGRIYTGSYMDFGYWESEPTGTLKYTSLLQKLNIPIKEDEQFWKIISSESMVLVQSLDRIYSYDPKKDEVKKVIDIEGLTKVFKVGNRLFYNVLWYGLYEIVDGTSKLIETQASIDGDVIAMHESSGEVVFVTSRNSLYRLNSNTVERISTNKFPAVLTVYSASSLSNGGFALGTISNGLLLTDAQGNIDFRLNQENGLSNNTVLSIFEDQDKNLWLGLDNGIDFIDLGSQYKTFTDRTGKIGTVYDALQHNGDLYLGTNQGVYVRQYGKSSFELIADTKGQVWMFREIYGTIFCGHNLGTFILYQNKAIKISGTEGTWDIKPIIGEPDLLLQGNYNGLHILQKQGSSWSLRNKVEGFNISSKDVAIQDGKIYVSHEYKGLYELSYSQDYTHIENFELISDVGSGINSDLMSINKDLIYTNKEGFFIKSIGSHSFTKNEKLTSLFRNGEYSSGRMIKTGDKQFWVFTKSALMQITVEPIANSYEVKEFLLPEKIRSEKNGYESLVMISERLYLIGTAMGYILLDTQIEIESYDSIYINKVRSISSSMDTVHDLSYPIELPSGSHKIEVSYGTTNYSPFTVVTYQYKMTGIQEEWSDPYSRNNLVFENLEHGDYELEIRPIINGVISTDIAHTKLKIDPPFYLSVVAIISYIILVTVFVFLVNIFYRSYYKSKKNRELLRQQKQLDLELLQSEKDITELKNQKLNDDIDARNRELAITTMAILKKNETLSEISAELDKMREGDSDDLRSVKSLISRNIGRQQDWKTFEQAFSMADKNFVKDLKQKHPSLTSGDLKLSIYLRLNLASKEIAPLLNISSRSVEIKRYRLRKKMNLDKKVELYEYLIHI
jgi:DNA-binding CsgD family transcriptional regulator